MVPVVTSNDRYFWVESNYEIADALRAEIVDRYQSIIGGSYKLNPAAYSGDTRFIGATITIIISKIPSAGADAS
jgi:hypothetical protein